MSTSHRSLVAPLALIAATCLVLSGCSRVEHGGGNGPGDAGRANGVVTIYGSIDGEDALLLEESWANWERDNNITIDYRAIADFDTEIVARSESGDAPDLAIFSNPTVVSDLVKLDQIQRVPKVVKANARQYWSADWTQYLSQDGVYYAAPLLANVQGLIWYSPTLFSARGWKVPTTWEELLALTADMRTQLGVEPWCAGFGSDAQAGQLGTDWIEDIILREAGPHIYDEWVAHRVKFSDPAIAHSFTSLKELLLGGIKSDASEGDGSESNGSESTASFADIAQSTEASAKDVATALSAGRCALAHQPATFERDLIDPLTANTTVSANGAIWAFIMPPFAAGASVVTGTGSIVAAFSNDADTIAVQKYLSSPEWANSRVKLGGVISANNGVNPAGASSPILGTSIKILQDPRTVFRLDGSYQMPEAVGVGAFPAGMVAWVGGASLKDVLASIDAKWPAEQPLTEQPLTKKPQE